MRTQLFLTLLAALPATSLGCASDPEPDVASRDGGFTTVCKKCGLNSPLIDGVPFNELPLDGSPNDADTSLVSVVTHDGNPAELVVRGDQLWARGERFFKPLKAGATLTIDIAGTEHELEIAAVSHVDHWVDPDGPQATAYHFQEVVSEFNRRNLCPVVEADHNVDLPGLPPNHFFAFAGDRYDYFTGEVITGAATNGWVTFACDGSAPSKLHLTRHTEAASRPEFKSEQEDRQALMYLYRADYCGSGEVHTVIGHPLRYLDANGWFEDFYDFGSDVEKFEALWDSQGAMCITMPRMGEGEILCDGVPIPACNVDPPALVWGDALFASGNPY